MMARTVKSQELVALDVHKALCENFIMNALDGSEDFMVRDGLYELVRRSSLLSVGSS